MIPPSRRLTVLACTADFRPTWPGAPDMAGWSIFDQETRRHNGDPLYDNERIAIRYMRAVHKQNISLLVDIPDYYRRYR